MPNPGFDGRLEPDENAIGLDSESAEPMTLCVAAGCWEDPQTPAVVLCADERGDRGLVGADDSGKIRWIDDNTSVLLAGSRTRADELYIAITPSLRKYRSLDHPDELDINDLLQSLKHCAHERKRSIMNEYTSLNLGMSLEEFQRTARERLHEGHYLDVWSEIRRLNLGTDLIITTFGQDEPVIIRMAATGEVFWENHYSTIGAGAPIAEAFMCQRGYPDPMEIWECIYRVYEAKAAAEKNRDVGQTTVIEVILRDQGRYPFPKKYFDALDKSVRGHLADLPHVTYPQDELKPVSVRQIRVKE